MTFPAELGTQLGQSGAAAGSISLDMTGTGEAQFPDRYHAVINAKMSGCRWPPKSWSPTARPT